jgi:hypothetical protein
MIPTHLEYSHFAPFPFRPIATLLPYLSAISPSSQFADSQFAPSPFHPFSFCPISISPHCIFSSPFYIFLLSLFLHPYNFNPNNKSLQKHCQTVFSRFLLMTIFFPVENTWHSENPGQNPAMGSCICFSKWWYSVSYHTTQD